MTTDEGTKGDLGAASGAEVGELISIVARARAAYVEARYRKNLGQLKETHTLGRLRREHARAQQALGREAHTRASKEA